MKDYKLSLIVCLLMVATQALCQVRLPSIISSGMVLQQNDSVTLWGWSEPQEKIFITTGWNDRTDSVVATNAAKWKLKIKTPAAGGPYTIMIRGRNVIELKDVLIGEVWICSGQSNMEMSGDWGLKDIKDELPTCANNNIRFFQVPKLTSENPQDIGGGHWAPCDSNTLKPFTAVGYFFGKKLNKELNIPVGLINASWGGTPAEVWTPAALVNDDPELRASADKQQVHEFWPKDPGLTYNGMISPIVNYDIAGAIWYQGEGNTSASLTYSKLFTTMIDAWRKAWNKNLPFYFVQIAPYTYWEPYIGSLLREQQAKTSLHENTGMVVVSDLVHDTTDIHPINKHDVGARLANWALSQAYHKEGIVYHSPVYKNMEVKKEKVVIAFDYAPNGLMIKGKKVETLLIAGADKIFYPAEAKIEGSTLTVWSKSVKQPVAVRFSFSNAGIGNLFSKEGLPAAPFRTDDW